MLDIDVDADIHIIYICTVYHNVIRLPLQCLLWMASSHRYPEAHTRAIVGGAVTAATAKGMTGMMPNLCKKRRNLLHLASPGYFELKKPRKMMENE